MVVLGSTGSIGTNALKIASEHNLEIEALACGKNIELLNSQIAKFNPRFVCIGDENALCGVKGISKDRIFIGQDGIKDMLNECKSDLVLNSLVGFAGLAPSLHTQKLGKKLALANKESLVVGGKFIDTSRIEAIDSEHFGLKFLLRANVDVSRLIITASGGAFYTKSIDELAHATPQMALKHPNWSMGAKITIDSASMANKLFEIIEAFWLFGIKDIDAIIEPSSIVHALVEFTDGSTTAHLSCPDMRLAIASAVLEKFGTPSVKPLDLTALLGIKFMPIDTAKYPIFSLKDQLLDTPDIGVVINAANEVCVYEFLKGGCGFLDISRVVLSAADKFKDTKISAPSEIFEIDKIVREFALKELYAKI
ncbi:1-deoxy-D-xylulose-5-phosphate reductoisomerase [Campylobacter sp. 19-13652]|uniref:1-deoxy-D-xylulose-5-phosphate reductoisomerase n=1 Tax=Campylobacter sp. 19-13652 TaxID=2840180 RepID=UPI001C75BF09|nr:1-deoxy-D-xylulose-5-phosphate reductoisomerase [Campylobacter sp. 19-13652]BCX79409.1 1-deoxy-D-xylulose 5-phosphate reductoisomerase [Campylobacter sp. 19-13652]